MIIFYKKDSGIISGTIDGRIHGEDHLKMWIGENTERLVINWKLVNGGLEPQCDQAQLIRDLDAGIVHIQNYKIDLQTKRFVAL